MERLGWSTANQIRVWIDDVSHDPTWDQFWVAWHKNLDGCQQECPFAQVELGLFQRVGINPGFISFNQDSTWQIGQWLAKYCKDDLGLSEDQAEDWFEENSIIWLWDTDAQIAYR